MAAPKRWMKITAVCMAVVMGLSRLYVGVHFPSDVLAGALTGSLCGLLGAWAVQNQRLIDMKGENYGSHNHG